MIDEYWTPTVSSSRDRGVEVLFNGGNGDLIVVPLSFAQAETLRDMLTDCLDFSWADKEKK